jgi:hypothetical protein
MKSMTILTASLVVVLTTMMAVTPAFAASYLSISKAEVTKHTLEIQTGANIPKDGSGGAFGYAVFGQNGLIAVTTHKGILDSDGQKNANDASFHTHIVQLNTNSGNCASQIQVVSASEDTVGKLKVQNNHVQVVEIPQSAVGKLSKTVVSFTLSVENGAICVNVQQLVTASG